MVDTNLNLNLSNLSPQSTDKALTNKYEVEKIMEENEEMGGETCDSGNYSQCENGYENSSEIYPNQSSSSDNDDSESSTDDDDENDNSLRLFSWIRKKIQKGLPPKSIIQRLLQSFNIPDSMDEETLWRIISLAITPRRKQLENVRTLEDAVQLIKYSRNIIILTGAGVSVSAGIPDFRSRESGLYARLSREYPSLPDPQSMFDIQFFLNDPRPFFKFAREIFPGQFKPSPSHYFIKKMEETGRLLRNYTQNIDTLERVADITRLVECHGSFQFARCTKCYKRINGDAIRDHIMKQQIPLCFYCNDTMNDIKIEDLNDNEELLKKLVTMGIFKPEIVFFGEELPDDFHDSINLDRDKCDLLIVIGSSMKVKPVAMIPNLIQPNIPQILINREPLQHMNFDVNLYGDSDIIINHLNKLIENEDDVALKEATVVLPNVNIDNLSDDDLFNTQQISALLPLNTYAKIGSNHYMFEGAEINLNNIKFFNDDDDEDESDSSDEDDDDDDGVLEGEEEEEEEEKIESSITHETISLSMNDEENHGPSTVKKLRLDD